MRAVIDAAYVVEEDIIRAASVSCYSCMQLGHFASDCPLPRRGGGGRRREQQQHQQLRVVAPPAGQVNAVMELPPDLIETVPTERDTPPLPLVIALVYRVGRFAAGGIFCNFIYILSFIYMHLGGCARLI